jgi:D-sedoheptulose 7-phosphate isomerase
MKGDTVAPAVTSLYPFLDTSAVERDQTLPDVLAEVDRSCAAKIGEIIELRRLVAVRYGDQLHDCALAMARRFTAGGRLLTFGNGGSSTDAQDLARLFVHPRPHRRSLPAIGLTNDVAVLTALTNDVGFDVVFARQIGAFGRPGDIAVALSTSGNSANLLRALDHARRLGMLTIGITGGDGGRMAELDGVDYLFTVPSPSVHRVQEAQATVYHAMWELTHAVLRSADLSTAPACAKARESRPIGGEAT